MSSGVVVITGELGHWEKLSDIVGSCGLRPIQCETLASVRELLAHEPVRAALCEDILPDGTFHELIRLLRESPRWHMPVIVVSPLDDWGSFLDAMMAGAFDYVAFPPYPHELERALAAALGESRTRQETPCLAVA